MAYEDGDETGLLWLYAIYIELNLTTGLFVVPISDCQEHYDQYGDFTNNLRDPEAKKRFLIIMWLWYDLFNRVVEL